MNKSCPKCNDIQLKYARYLSYKSDLKILCSECKDPHKEQQYRGLRWRNKKITRLEKELEKERQAHRLTEKAHEHALELWHDEQESHKETEKLYRSREELWKQARGNYSNECKKSNRLREALNFIIRKTDEALKGKEGKTLVTGPAVSPYIVPEDFKGKEGEEMLNPDEQEQFNRVTKAVFDKPKDEDGTGKDQFVCSICGGLKSCGFAHSDNVFCKCAEIEKVKDECAKLKKELTFLKATDNLVGANGILNQRIEAIEYERDEARKELKQARADAAAYRKWSIDFITAKSPKANMYGGRWHPLDEERIEQLKKLIIIDAGKDLLEELEAYRKCGDIKHIKDVQVALDREARYAVKNWVLTP